MGPLGRAARSRVIYSISRVGATRWRQWVGAVALYYPIPSERNKPHATSATVPGETAMVKRLLGALRTGPDATEVRGERFVSSAHLSVACFQVLPLGVYSTDSWL